MLDRRTLLAARAAPGALPQPVARCVCAPADDGDGARQRARGAGTFRTRATPTAWPAVALPGLGSVLLHDLRVLVSGVYRKPLENEGGKPLSFNGPFWLWCLSNKQRAAMGVPASTNTPSHDDVELAPGRILEHAPAGKLMFQVWGAFAEFERSMIRQRIHAGLKRAVAQGTQLRECPSEHEKRSTSTSNRSTRTAGLQRPA